MYQEQALFFMYHVFHPPDAYDIDIIRYETRFRAIPIKTKSIRLAGCLRMMMPFFQFMRRRLRDKPILFHHVKAPVHMLFNMFCFFFRQDPVLNIFGYNMFSFFEHFFSSDSISFSAVP